MSIRLRWCRAILAGWLVCAGLSLHGQAPATEFNLEEVQARADSNDPQAQTTLGTLYQLGQAGLKADYKEAMKWFQKAAAQGDPGAMYRIGYLYHSGQGVSQSIPEAVRWFKKSAQAGFGIAQYTIGNMFLNGHGMELNYSEAIRWFYFAAEQGYAPAQHQLGVLIFQGKGVPQDFLEGCKWFYIAADQGHPNAIEALTTVALPLMGRDEMERAAELAKEFKPQPPRVVPERPEPPPIYHTLLAKANAGDVHAQYDLALLLQTGLPTTEDLKEARKWVLKAAAGGHAEAQHQLGSMYFLGQGLTKDFVAAYKWLTLSANQGRTNAIPGRDRVANVMTPQQVAEARRQVAAFQPTRGAEATVASAASTAGTNAPASVTPVASNVPSAQSPTASAPPKTTPPTPVANLKPAVAAGDPSPLDVVSLRRDAEAGKPESQLSLGLIYLHGKGVTANKDEARKWLEKSANQGHAPAQYWLATTFDAAQQPDRVKWMRRAADRGFGLAQFMVGQMYFSGQGVPQDMIEAYKWLHLASQQGNPAADAFLDTVAPVMAPGQVDEAKRRADEVAFRLKNP